jgi:hypothetical protein
MYISGQFFYGFKLLDMSGQISYDFDEKLLNFNNSHQTGVERWKIIASCCLRSKLYSILYENQIPLIKVK